ncbi:MAG: toluene tolerance protein [Methylophilaceae bacterium]|nr:toluene tolerance protein [Methylophilaceae bacterium]
MRKSEVLSQKTFEGLLEGAAVLEQDERGIKVLRLSNDEILKVFRVRNQFSIARIYSYARKFCRNAERLGKKGIPTVQVTKLLHLENPAITAVRYMPLAGKTLREITKVRMLTLAESRRLGEFIAELHQKGVHFRSLHLGNIVLGDDGALGLIDVADMRIYPWSLWCNTRARSFSHLHRYPDQVHALGYETWQIIERTYFENADIGEACRRHLHQHLHKISVFAQGSL